MYDLPHHKALNEDDISQFIARYPFALVTGCDKECKPVATQIPVFIEKEGAKSFLRGHIMKNTDHHNAFLENEHVRVIFTGPHVYVSATWYSNPHMASTWNYMSVHAIGRLKFLDESALEKVLRKVTLHFENYDSESTTVYDNLPDEFKRRVMHAIVAFEIEIDKIDSVFKLSQDRDQQSYENIIVKLRGQGGDAEMIATEMENRRHAVFAVK